MATKAKETTELATTTGNALSIPGVDFMADAGHGMEGADKDSFAIPFIKVLQKISPQVDEADGAYIEGAKGGMLFNTVSQRLYEGKDTGLTFVPCAFQRRFIHWGPRGGDGAGFKGEYTVEEAAQFQARGAVIEKEGKLLFPLPDGTLDEKKCERLTDTRNHFGLIVDPETGEFSRAVLSLSSTQIKKSKLLMGMIAEVKVKTTTGQLVTPPTWANMIKVTTVPESNDQGSWYGVRFTSAGFVQSADVYNAGKEFHAAITAGEAKVNYNDIDDAARAAEGGDGEKF